MVVNCNLICAHCGRLATTTVVMGYTARAFCAERAAEVEARMNGRVQ
jgi:hypothetical protein